LGGRNGGPQFPFDEAVPAQVHSDTQAAVAGGLLWRLGPHLDGERAPGAVYVAVIATMGWQALAQWIGTGEPWAALAFVGAAAVLFSDAALAFDRFRGAFAHAPAVVLGSYYVAQWLIAASISR